MLVVLLLHILPYIAGANTTKVISLSPNTTAIIRNVIMFAQKTSEEDNAKLIATIYYPGQPEYYQQYENIGSFQALNVTKILMLKPDIVITWQGQTQPQTITLLERFGIKVKIFNADNLEELGKTFVEIGTAINLNQAATKLQLDFMHKINQATQNKNKPKRSITLLFQLAEKPIFVAGGSGILNDIITRCGGENVFKSIKKVSFETDVSAILKENPQLIIMLGTMKTAWQKQPNSMWQQWTYLKAVKNHFVYQLSSDEISQFSPQIVTGIISMCDILSSANSQLHP